MTFVIEIYIYEPDIFELGNSFDLINYKGPNPVRKAERK